MYGEPVMPSGGPSGSICHHDCPAAASQSTKRTPAAQHARRQRGRMEQHSGGAPEVHAFRTGRRRESHAVPVPEDPPTAHPDPGVRADRRLRPLPGQAHGRRRGRGLRDVFTRRSRHAGGAVRVRRPASARGGGAAASRSATIAGAGRSGRPAGALAVPGRGLDRPDRDLADELGARSRRARTTSPSELSEGARSSARDRLTVGTALAPRRGRPARDEVDARQTPRGRRRPGARALRRAGTSFSRDRGAASRGVAEVLPRLAALGFDVVYLPPVHPIGHTNRKGRNNTLDAGPGRPRLAVGDRRRRGRPRRDQPRARNVGDFDGWSRRARLGSTRARLRDPVLARPPVAEEHPEWFHRRPDGTLKYAENPPKKYQDIYNVNFESEDWQGLWQALRDVVLFWVGRGVRCSASTTRTRSRCRSGSG